MRPDRATRWHRSDPKRIGCGTRISVLHLGLPVRFTWDPGKAVTNLRKHGVTFEEATTVFGDPLALIVEDAVDPDRALIIGESVVHRILVTAFLEVRENDIRIISARRATRRERRRYGAGKEV
jgi:uncharacterized protein